MQAWNLIERNMYMLLKSDKKDITEKEKLFFRNVTCSTVLCPTL